MADQDYEDFTIDDTASSAIARTISESEVYTQAGLEGNYSRIHTDAEYMADTKYGQRLVQNTLLMETRRSPGATEHALRSAGAVLSTGRFERGRLRPHSGGGRAVPGRRARTCRLWRRY